jgi:uncharacterized protein YlaI
MQRYKTCIMTPINPFNTTQVKVILGRRLVGRNVTPLTRELKFLCIICKHSVHISHENTSRLRYKNEPVVEDRVSHKTRNTFQTFLNYLTTFT